LNEICSYAQDDASAHFDKELAAIGTARVLKGDAVSARESAIHQAMSKGLEVHLLRRLGSKAVANHFTRILSQVIPSAREATASYQLLAEDRSGDSISVLIAMKVNDAVLDAKLKQAEIGVAYENSKKVLVLIAETGERADEGFHWWGATTGNFSLTPLELAFYSALQEKGLSAINRTGMFPGADGSDSMKSANLSDHEVFEWGNIYSADLVLYGKCRVREGKVESLNLKLHDVGSGTVIWEESLMEEGAFEPMMAARKAVDKIIYVKDRARSMGKTGSSEFNVVFEGLVGAGQIQLLSGFLKNDVQGVKGVIPARMRKDSVAFRVGYEGRADILVNAILKNPAVPLKVEFREANDNVIFFRSLEPSR
jgi:hypothetical protein